MVNIFPCPATVKDESWAKRTSEGYFTKYTPRDNFRVRKSLTSGFQPDVELQRQEIISSKPIGYSEPIAIPVKKEQIKKEQRVIGGIQITPDLEQLADMIEASRKILSLEDDWDGEGSPGYEEDTWLRAIKGLLKAAPLYFQTQVGILRVPTIYNGPEGSIDILWETADHRLLINVPKDTGKPASYYGYNSCGELKGTFETSDINRWLMLMMW